MGTWCRWITYIFVVYKSSEIFPVTSGLTSSLLYYYLKYIKIYRRKLHDIPTICVHTCKIYAARHGVDFRCRNIVKVFSVAYVQSSYFTRERIDIFWPDPCPECYDKKNVRRVNQPGRKRSLTARNGGGENYYRFLI